MRNQKIEEAKEDARQKKDHTESRRRIVMDYAQNVGLPQFGDSQAGPSYYYSPITVNIFGIVDTSKVGGRLDAIVYHKGQGGKVERGVITLLLCL